MRQAFRVLGVVFVGLVIACDSLADGGRAPGVLRLVAQKGAGKARSKRPAPRSDAPAKDTPASPEPAPAGPPSFAKEIAPILVANCLGCHDAKQKRGKLDLSTFESLMQGTPTEKVIVAAKPEESHLVLRIKGEEKPKMPQGGDRNLSAEAVTRVERWIKAGALLDAGLLATDPLTKYAASPEQIRKSELAKLPANARDKKVEEVGLERWKKASSKTTPEVNAGTHFLLFSNLPKSRAAAVQRVLEAQYNQVRGLLGPEPLEWGEKASLFVFNDRASFVEFVRLNESREVDANVQGSAGMSVPEPYVVAIDPLGGRDEPSQPAASKKGGRGRGKRREEPAADVPSRSVAGLLTEQFAIGVAGRAGKTPRWVSLGLGALLGSRVEPRSPYYQRLRTSALNLAERGWNAGATEALGDATKSEDVRSVGLAVLETLVTTSPESLSPFLHGMTSGGANLDEVIGEVLHVNRAQFLEATGMFVSTHYQGAGR